MKNEKFIEWKNVKIKAKESVERPYSVIVQGEYILEMTLNPKKYKNNSETYKRSFRILWTCSLWSFS